MNQENQEIRTARKILNLMDRNIKETIKKNKIKNLAVAFSGLDSSIVAFLVKKYCNPTLYNVCRKDSFDDSISKKHAKLLNLKFKKIRVEDEEIEKSLKEFFRINKIKKSIEINELLGNLPIFIVSKYTKEKFIFTGQGADKLFFGFQKYKNMTIEELKKETQLIPQNTRNNLRMNKFISKFSGKMIYSPFLEETFVDFINSISIKSRKNEKELLREVATKISLPKEIIKKKKKSAQYSAGIIKGIRKIAKERGLKTGEYLKNILKIKKPAI
jgi:asparagine synthase (glutamine-hydrolysing)